MAGESLVSPIHASLSNSLRNPQKLLRQTVASSAKLAQLIKAEILFQPAVEDYSFVQASYKKKYQCLNPGTLQKPDPTAGDASRYLQSVVAMFADKAKQREVEGQQQKPVGAKSKVGRQLSVKQKQELLKVTSTAIFNGSVSKKKKGDTQQQHAHEEESYPVSASSGCDRVPVVLSSSKGPSSGLITGGGETAQPKDKSSKVPKFDGKKDTNISHLMQRIFSSQGYGPTVKSWDDTKSSMNQEADRDKKKSRKRTWGDNYEAELDAGRKRKVKKTVSSHEKPKGNLFQKQYEKQREESGTLDF